MTSLPASQAWLYVRNNSSFLVKRNGVQFSREPGNLTQLNTYKSSGLCNDKAIDINLDEDGKIVMALKAPKRATKPAKSLNKTPLRKNFRRSAKAIQSQTAGKFYRGDLTGKALARYAALHRFTKVQQGLAKKAKTKTGRRGAVGRRRRGRCPADCVDGGNTALSYLFDRRRDASALPLSVARRRRGAMASRGGERALLHAARVGQHETSRVRVGAGARRASSTPSTLRSSLLPRLQNPKARRRDEVVVLLRQVLAVLVVVDTFPLITLGDLLPHDFHRFFRDDPLPALVVPGPGRIQPDRRGGGRRPSSPTGHGDRVSVGHPPGRRRCRARRAWWRGGGGERSAGFNGRRVRGRVAASRWLAAAPQEGLCGAGGGKATAADAA